MKNKKVLAWITSVVLLFIMITPITARGDALDQPTVAAGVESLTVTGFTSGATLKLYRTDNGTTPVQTASNVTASEYIFSNVEPNTLQYYVTQTVATVEGAGSSFVNSILRTPTASAGIGYVDAGNIYPGATIELHITDGTLISDTPVDQGGGVYRFSSLTAGTQYYVMQKINSVVSSGTSLVTVLSNVPSAPTVTGEEEAIKVTGFTSGATLKLYRTDNGTTPVQTASNVTASEYTFSSVAPNSLQYYVTQTVASVEGTGSGFVNSILRTPTASAGIGYVDAGNIYPGATIELHITDGTLISDTPVDQGGGVYRFSSLTAGTQYYVMQKINGVVSSGTSLVTVLSNVPSAPTVTGEQEAIKVTGFTSGATLKLYRTDNGTTPVLTASNVTASEYTFSSVAPNSLQYYVTQTVASVEGTGSGFVNSILRTPTASAGIGYVDAGNIYPGATIELHITDGTLISDTPVDQGGGVYRFSSLTAGTQYYVMQKINGVVSSGTSLVMVLSNVPSAPTVTGEEEAIKVTGFTSGATLKLYRTDNGTTPVQTASNVTASEYTFSNVVPNSLQYYVTQTVATVESVNSIFVNSSLRTPTASAGIGYVDAGNIYLGATIELYRADGTPISDTPADQGGGVYRFISLTAGTQYYVVQKINSVESSGTSLVTVLSNVPSVPTVTGEEEAIKVTGFTSGATLKLYRTDNGTTPVQTASNVTASEYTFSNVVPNSLQYYVTQTDATVESVNSIFVNSSLRTPTASAGIGYVDAGNIYPGATIELYKADGTFISNTPTVHGSGVYRFSGLMDGTRYYVIQKINHTVSSATGWVTVLAFVPSAWNSAPETNTKQISVNVKEGASEDTVAQIVIERTTEESGRMTDKITYSGEKAIETVKKLQEEGKDTARIVIPDVKDEVAETLVTIPDASVKTLIQGNINLQIDTNSAKIEIPKDSLQNANESLAEDLYFNLVPIRSDDEKKDVIDRANQWVTVSLGNAQGTMTNVGNPVTIETNMPSSSVYITLPLTNLNIPEDEKEREALLKELAVYIEHSDGETELVQGEIVEFSKGVFGIRFKINKFSIFTLVRTDIFKKSAEKDVLKVKTPLDASIQKSNIRANVDHKTSSLTVALSVSKGAAWKLYSDKDCKNIISNAKVSLKTGSNIFYIKVTAENGSAKIYRLTMIRSKSKAAELLKGIIPENAIIKDNILSASVNNKMDKLDVRVSVSKGATYQIYLDKKCTKPLADHKLILTPGLNTAYVKVTAQDGKTSKIYIVKINRATEYQERVKLGLIKNKTYVEKVAKIFASEYDTSNVTVKKEGDYYRISIDFKSISDAKTICDDMVRRQYIVNYYMK